ARLLEEVGSLDEVLRASLPRLERCNLPSAVAQAVTRKQSFKRAGKELATVRNIDRCRLLHWTDPQYPQNFARFTPPLFSSMFRVDIEALSQPSISIVGTRRPTLYDGRAVGKGTRLSRPRHCQWAGARHRRLLPQRKPQARRQSNGTRCSDQLVSLALTP